MFSPDFLFPRFLVFPPGQSYIVTLQSVVKMFWSSKNIYLIEVSKIRLVDCSVM